MKRDAVEIVRITTDFNIENILSLLFYLQERFGRRCFGSGKSLTFSNFSNSAEIQIMRK